ncbi:hypothetical protein ACFO0N_02275 [Halobium salinum]|uniref:ABC transporter ATP-binding protein n=1 Tax=Halobium salinum TaxID=1364940 RepID=A0ABD5P7Q2_9EURY|nr:hypothetical protein [Halobium salinum]
MATDTDSSDASTLKLAGRRVERDTLLVAGLLVNSLLIFALGYAALVGVGVLEPYRFSLYGLLWLGASVWAVSRVEVPDASTRTKRRAAAVAVGYFAVLAVAGGLVVLPGPGSVPGFRVAILPPGWGPAPVFTTDVVNLVLMPARVVGYLALAYLVYATVVDAAGAAVSGVVGLLSCVSCSWPVLAGVATTLFGSSGALASATMALSYDLSTAVFLVTVALLSYRPSFGRS